MATSCAEPWKSGDPDRRAPAESYDENRLATAIAAKLREHPPQCMLGLDPETVKTLKEIADGYRAGKSRAVHWMVKLAMLGLGLAAWKALAEFDFKAVIANLKP